MESARTPETRRCEDFWSTVRRRLGRNRLGLVGLAAIAAIALIAVLAPMLASSTPLVIKSARPILSLSGEEVFAPGVSFPLLGALQKVDLLLLSASVAAACAGFLYRARRRRGGSRRGAAAFALGAPALAVAVLSVAILGFHASARNLTDQVDFHAVESRLGPGEWSIWPPVRYGPTYIDGRVDSWLRPPWLGFDEEDERVARRLGGEDWRRHVAGHLLGTDDQKRDILSRILHGARVSLSVGVVAVSIYVMIGVIVGALAGFYGGRVDAVIMRVIEIVTCFPSLVLVVTIAAVYPPSVYLVTVVIALVSWPFVARLVRAEFLRLREADFVQAAVALGASDWRVIFRHILPNAVAPVLVAATFGVAGAILVESSLSFMGIGVPIDAPTWGNILRVGRMFPRLAWWVTLFPGLAILITIVSYNLFAEALRDALDPRWKGSGRGG